MTDSLTSPIQPRAALRSWPQDALRIAFGAIWAIDAVLKWLPGFRSSYVADITGAAKGQPGWLSWWFDFWVKLQTPRPTFFAYFVAVLETLVALALIFGFARKLSYISIAVFSFLMWGVAEGFGGPYMTGSTDIGTSVIYVVVCLGLLVVAYYAGTSRYSVDHYIEQRISWWWKVAEVGRPAPIAPPHSIVLTVPDPPIDLGSLGLANARPKEPVLQ
jgi:nitrite reductase (NO-forming)